MTPSTGIALALASLALVATPWSRQRHRPTPAGAADLPTQVPAQRHLVRRAGARRAPGHQHPEEKPGNGRGLESGAPGTRTRSQRLKRPLLYH
jgi:hypothetical protein